jgi:hypothetical protein
MSWSNSQFHDEYQKFMETTFNPTLDPKCNTAFHQEENARILKRMQSSLIDVFKSSTDSRERDFEIGQRAMLERAIKAETALRELLDAVKKMDGLKPLVEIAQAEVILSNHIISDLHENPRQP